MSESPWIKPLTLPLPPLWAANPACDHLMAVETRLGQLHLNLTPKDVEGPIFGLIVGEEPSVSTSKYLPMFPYPSRSSGGRLLAMSGLTPGQYFGRMRRINLSDSPDGWSAASARAAAAEVRRLLHADVVHRRSSTSDAEPLRVLLCGARVAAAFGIKQPFASVTESLLLAEADTSVTVEIRTIPHPSARNPVYLDEQMRIAAGIAVRWCAGYF